jgi:hypothetical protein
MCYFCGQPFTGDKVYRSTTCTKCGKDLHSCLNCRFYSKGSYRDCRESISEAVTEKESANFCDYFESADKDASSKDQKKAQDAKSQLAKLFGDI